MANLDDAVGYWLDIHGSRVAEKRDGRDDDEYRDAIKFKIALKSPKATISAIFKALNFYFYNHYSIFAFQNTCKNHF